MPPGLDAGDDQGRVEDLVRRGHDPRQVEDHKGRDDSDGRVRRADLLVVTTVTVLA